MIHRVPARYAGCRPARVYPGFLQLTAFVMMNPDKHASAYWTYWLDQLRGDAAATAVHEKFYDEYNAVLDMDAPYYLDTVRVGVPGVRARARDLGCRRPARRAGRDRAHADLHDRGREARRHLRRRPDRRGALELCANAPGKRQHVAARCGHYGLFSGSFGGASRSIPRSPRVHRGRTVSLAGKTALVTGSTSGIGLGIAAALAHEGAAIILNGFGDVAPARAPDVGRPRVGYHGANLSRARRRSRTSWPTPRASSAASISS